VEAATAAITDVGRQVGRYFSMLNGLSSVLAIGVPAIIILSGAPQRTPDLAQGLSWIAQASVAELVVAGVLAWAIALILHPLQFAFTQLLEGYWGTSAWAIAAMTRGIDRNLERWNRLSSLRDDSEERASRIDDRIAEFSNVTNSKAYRDSTRPLIEERVRWIVAAQEARREGSRLPDRTEDIMPTRLGNVLRRHERLAGAPFGLEATAAAPYLAQLGSRNELQYLDDARSAMDLSVRMVLVWSMDAVLTAAVLWRYGTWMTVPVVCILCSWLSYYGAVANASRYGNALTVTAALAKGELYARLNLELPRSTADERSRNEALNLILAGRRADITYAEHKHGPPPSGPGSDLSY
jgi:hypothetical protein